MDADQLTDSFATHAELHHRHSLEGDWKKANEQIEIINSLFEQIKKVQAREKLLNLTDSTDLEVAALAATYSMTYNPDKCLSKMRELESLNIPHISTAAKYAIQNWKNKEWFID